MTTVAGSGPPRADARALFEGWAHGVLITRGDPPDTLTYTLPGAPASGSAARTEPLSVRVPTNGEAVRWVQREARLLVELRRRRLGPVERTIPRHVGVCQLDGLLVAMASVVPGRPMTVQGNRWLHVPRPDLVRRDFQQAARWLSRFQDASAASASRLTWGVEVTEALRHRVGLDALATAGLANLAPAVDRLDGHLVDRSAVHGDFSPGNLLLHEADIGGVVNWARGETAGWPLRDVVRFALRYSQYLDHHVRAGRRVGASAGHRRAGPAPGIRHGLLGAGWYPRIVRAHLCEGLDRLGMPPGLWYDAALVGLAEMAAEARDAAAADELLTLLSILPAGRSSD